MGVGVEGVLQLSVGQAAWVLGLECPASLGDRWQAVKDRSLAWVHRRAGFRMEQASNSGLWNCILGERLEKLGDMASCLGPTPPGPDKPIETSIGR